MYIIIYKQICPFLILLIKAKLGKDKYEQAKVTVHKMVSTTPIDKLVEAVHCQDFKQDNDAII